MIWISSILTKAKAIIYVTKVKEAVMTRSRQAGAHRFDGVYAFEVLRRIAGDAAAEEFLLVDYQLPKRSRGTPYIASGSVDVAHSDRIDAGAKFAARGLAEL